MNSKFITWLIFVLTSLIWGSSFILMKIGLYGDNHGPTLTAIQVASLRIFSAGLVLSPFLWRDLNSIPKLKYLPLFFSGLLGIFLPAFLFCLAETRISSALTGTINALTPLFVILTGMFFARSKVPVKQAAGITIGFAGTILLFFSSRNQLGDATDTGFASLVVLATVCYGINANIVKQSLSTVQSITIASFTFGLFAIPAVIILFCSGYFQLPLSHLMYLRSTLAACFLGVVGSALAWFLFYALIKRSSALFATSATYAIPFVAMGWGWIYGERITLIQIVCLLIILVGVYLTRPEKKKS